MFGASLLHGVMFLKASLRSLKRKRGVGGGGIGAPHLQTQRLYDGFWEGPYMGSVFAGRMMLEATLLSSIKHEYSTL